MPVSSLYENVSGTPDETRPGRFSFCNSLGSHQALRGSIKSSYQASHSGCGRSKDVETLYLYHLNPLPILFSLTFICHSFILRLFDIRSCSISILPPIASTAQGGLSFNPGGDILVHLFDHIFPSLYIQFTPFGRPTAFFEQKT